MLERLKAKLKPEKKTRLIVPVDDWNLPAQLWLKSQGMRATASGDVYKFEWTVEEKTEPAPF